MTTIPGSSTFTSTPGTNLTTTKDSLTRSNSSDDKFLSPLAVGLILEPGIVAVCLGNLLVLLSLRFQRKWIVSDVLLFSLSLADFIDGLIPLQAVVFMNYFLQAPWSKVLCDVYIGVVNTCRFASAGTVTLIAVERTLMLVFPFRYHTAVTISRAKKIVVVTWLNSVLVAILPFVGFGKSGFRESKCFYHLSDLGAQYAVFVLSVSLLLLLTVLACSIVVKLSSTRFIRRQTRTQTVKASKAPNNKSRRAQFSKEERGESHHTTRRNRPHGVKAIRKLSVMMALVVVLYYISWLPILITSVVTLISGDEPNKVVVLVTGMISLIYALANPVLYGKMSPRYRRGYKCVIGRLLVPCGLRPGSWKISSVSGFSRTSQLVQNPTENIPTTRRTVAEMNKKYSSDVKPVHQDTHYVQEISSSHDSKASFHSSVEKESAAENDTRL